ncbi:glycosyltransferase family 4 protein [Halobacillus litoralis]|uniref:glycosyltransferase family 4 protein n=1 Tax=Halobacillus litoralis TaxID=45668 RepID=UPI001CFCF9DC|nr:glycosyltransferase family 4 protein [Halobacillus litoralis]WLR49127.1 glycosyltransferase family 4 protein [Halobacillus litoralis]
MPKKVLFCATVDYHFQLFHLPYLKWFKEQGWEVHVAANGNMTLPYVDVKYEIPIQRSPLAQKNIEAYKILKHLIDKNQYQIVHCHTPMGGTLARLAARSARKRGTKVIYTAHGFHFCKGAPLANWFLYYPIEWKLAFYTDCLITINQEDYQLAQKRFKTKHIEHVHGVGVDTDEFKPLSPVEKMKARESFGYKPNDFLLFYAAEFNKNKNQKLLIQALALLKKDVPKARLLLAGEGCTWAECKQLAKKLGVENMVDFLGYRNDIKEIVSICDAVAASSLREGLPVNIMEAMACSTPVVAIDNRGHRELVKDNVNGWVLPKNEVIEFSKKLKLIAEIEDVKEKLGANARNMILNKYSTNRVIKQNSRIYQTYMDGGERKLWAVR